MKKFCIYSVLVVLFISLFISCSGPSEPDSESLFKDAVQEVYKLTGALLFFSDDMDPNSTPSEHNRVSGPNESPAWCIDYTVEFVNYWNNIKNYDEVFGRAYFAYHGAVDKIFRIIDGEIVPPGTSYINWMDPWHKSTTDNIEMSSVLHDVLITDTLFSKPGGVPHFQSDNAIEHMWPIILFEGDWWDTDPTGWDNNLDDYVPYKISYR
jgi:hypothetical protein